MSYGTLPVLLVFTLTFIHLNMWGPNKYIKYKIRLGVLNNTIEYDWMNLGLDSLKVPFSIVDFPAIVLFLGAGVAIFEMAGMPFPCNGILLFQGNLPRVIQVVFLMYRNNLPVFVSHI